jgi:hypothetical protein
MIPSTISIKIQKNHDGISKLQQLYQNWRLPAQESKRRTVNDASLLLSLLILNVHIDVALSPTAPKNTLTRWFSRSSKSSSNPSKQDT